MFLIHKRDTLLLLVQSVISFFNEPLLHRFYNKSLSVLKYVLTLDHQLILNHPYINEISHEHKFKFLRLITRNRSLFLYKNLNPSISHYLHFTSLTPILGNIATKPCIWLAMI